MALTLPKREHLRERKKKRIKKNQNVGKRTRDKQGPQQRTEGAEKKKKQKKHKASPTTKSAGHDAEAA